jgi:hypothetical protein
MQRSTPPLQTFCVPLEPESLTDEEKAGILGGNAARLFGMNG